MSDYFERVEAHLLDAVEREARRRARGFPRAAGSLRGRHSHRVAGSLRRDRAPGGARRGALRLLGGPRRGLWLLAAVLLLGGSAAAAALIAGERSRSLSGVVPPYDARGNLSVAGARYEITIGPSLEPGSIGWCTWIQFRDVPSLRARGGGGMGGGGCGGGTPAVGSPLFGPDGDRGPGLWYVLTAPQVAAVRVANGPTVLTRSSTRLPFGFRAAVFELPADTPTGRAPRLTALDAAGRAIAGSFYETPPQEPARYWQRSRGLRQPPQGRCPLTVRPGSGASAREGEILTAIAPDPGIVGHAYLSCAGLGFRLRGSWFKAAVLLDAKQPGTPPAALPDMRAVPGAPGFFDRAGAFGSQDLTARRVGDAWLVVQGEVSVSLRVRALRALRVGAIDVRPPRRAPGPPVGAPCGIVVDPLVGPGAYPRADLRVVSQSAMTRAQLDGFLAAPGAPGAVELVQCANAYLYDGDWPLQATVLLIGPGRGPFRGLAEKRAVPGHPGVFTVRSEEEGTLETVRRLGDAWLEVKGGSGTAQQRIVLERLAVHTPPPGWFEPRPRAHPPSGEGGMRVSPRTSGMSMAISSTKHHDQVSPGSSERMIGWPPER
jgi:hypothetical protein